MTKMPADNERFGATAAVAPRKRLCGIERLSPARTFVNPRPTQSRHYVVCHFGTCGSRKNEKMKKILIAGIFSILTFQLYSQVDSVEKTRYERIFIDIDFSAKENAKFHRKEARKQGDTYQYYFFDRSVIKDVWYRLWFIVEQDTFYAPHISGYLDSKYHYVSNKVTDAFFKNTEVTLIIETSKKLYFIENLQKLQMQKFGYKICYMGAILIYKGGCLRKIPLDRGDFSVTKKSTIRYTNRKLVRYWGTYYFTENALPQFLYNPKPIRKKNNWQPFNAINDKIQLPTEKL
jgi:hypothetical protein